MIVKCNYCSNEINKKPCHIKKHTKLGLFCNNSCKINFMRSEDGKKILSIIKKEAYLRGSNSGFKKGILNYTHINGSPCKGKKRDPFSKKTKEKMRDARIGKKFPEQSKTRKRLFKEGKLKSWNEGLTKKTDKRLKIVSIKTSKTRTKRIQEGKINPFKGLNITPTHPERLMIDIIKKNNLPFDYVGDGKIWIRGKNQSFNPDFFSKKLRCIIEVFGNYWHNRKEAIERDKKRINTYKKYGYSVIIFWDYEINNQREVLNKLNSFINKGEIKNG